MDTIYPRWTSHKKEYVFYHDDLSQLNIIADSETLGILGIAYCEVLAGVVWDADLGKLGPSVEEK